MNRNNYEYDTKITNNYIHSNLQSNLIFSIWSLVIILCILDIVQIIMIVVNFVAEMAVSSYQLIQSPLNANIKKDKEY